MSLAPSPGHPPRSPLPYPLGWFGALFYAPIIRRINRKFDAGKGVVTLDRPVLSVGNLSVGGTGKTPMVMHVLRTLIDARIRPCVAIRGYAAVNGHSDEADELSRAFRDVSIVVGSNRATSLISYFSTPQGETTDCVVLDDGFQHRQLARQLDIVLVDASRNPFRDELLPAGWLREPVGSLRRAHAVVITHAEAVTPIVLNDLKRSIADLCPRALLAVCSHEWTGLRLADEGRERDESLDWLSSKRVVAACAIGNPSPFFRTAQTIAGSLVARIQLKDHDPYSQGTVEKILRSLRQHQAEALLVTEKDWSKLRRYPTSTWPCPIARPRLGLRFSEGETQLREAIVSCAASPPE